MDVLRRAQGRTDRVSGLLVGPRLYNGDALRTTSSTLVLQHRLEVRLAEEPHLHQYVSEAAAVLDLLLQRLLQLRLRDQPVLLDKQLSEGGAP
jgi:hypothetical protein